MDTSENERLPIPTHMQHVASMSSMDLLSESSQSDVETKSPSSVSTERVLSSPPAPGTSHWRYLDSEEEEEEEEVDYDPGPTCTGVNLKEYIRDLSLYSHAALIGDMPKKASLYDEPERPIDLSITENACTSTYEKWKKLSGPMVLFLILGLIVLIWGRGHLVQLLSWLEHLPLHQSILVFVVLFTLISFPFGFGYIILNMMAGYLYGILHGQLIVMISVAVGVSISFLLCRKWLREYAQTMVTSNALQAVLKVVEGPHGFKVIFLTRFTPIPFGLQNVLFAVRDHNAVVFCSIIALFGGWLMHERACDSLKHLSSSHDHLKDSRHVNGVLESQKDIP